MLRRSQFIGSKKGQIWISAALYIALGLILITIILSVGMPFIDKIKDRNTVLQTKNILYEMDKLVLEVGMEGVGSRRPFYVDIEEGDFLIKDDANAEMIRWKFISENKLGIESGESVTDTHFDEGVCAGALTGCGPLIKEGNLNIQSRKVGQGYEINLWLNYLNKANIDSSYNQLSGGNNLIIEHRYADAKGGDYVAIEST